MAVQNNGEWILRMEDIDFNRVRKTYADAIFEDLKWMGLKWPEPVLFQSNRSNAYHQALERLRELGVIYGCACTRKDIALSAPHGASSHYSGKCRELKLNGENLNWRLNASKAFSLVGDLQYREIGQHRDGFVPVTEIDDVVLARKDIGCSYHLAVVVDDAYQGITHITRGEDLEAQTPIHILLQALLDLPHPIYRHHQLIRDENGKRLAKRDESREIRACRNEGMKRAEFLDLVKTHPSLS